MYAASVSALIMTFAVGCVGSSATVVHDAGDVANAPDVSTVGDSSVVPPPRQLAPMSTSTVTSQTPTLKWVLANGTDGARAVVCRDRACETTEQTYDVTGTSGRVPAVLSPGVHYWRLASRHGGVVVSAQSSTWEFFVGHRSAEVDTSAGTTGDFNGDGFADVDVGATSVDEVRVYEGRSGGVVTPPTVLAGASGSQFGASVTSAGDVNGDGFADLAVGALGSNTVTIYPGGANGFTVAPMTLTIARSIEFGLTVAGVGDTNGDGYADLAVCSGVPDSTVVYMGGPEGLIDAPRMVNGPGGVGGCAERAGDVNGDGFADVIVGAPLFNTASVDLGGPTGLSAMSMTLNGRDGSAFGNSVSSAGDVNGDGYSDVIIGAYDANAAFVDLGGAQGIGATPTMLSGPTAGGFFGQTVASAGDVNGDGFDDVVVSAQGSATVWLFFGSDTGIQTSGTTVVVPGAMNQTVAAMGVGDVNGDGFSDVVVSAEGGTSAYLYLGGASGVAATPTVLDVPVGGGSHRHAANRSAVEGRGQESHMGEIRTRASRVERA